MPYLKPRAEGQMDAWTEETRQRGVTGSSVLRDVAEELPPSDVAKALNLPPGGRVVVRRRTMLADDVPVELTDSYFPSSIAAGTMLAERRKVRGGAVAVLAELGCRPYHVQEDVEARMPSAAERDLLRLGDIQLVLTLFRISSTEDGTPVEVTTMTMRAEGRRLRYQLSVG